MVTRELLRFIWKYDQGIVTLVDKKKGIMFSLPIAYMDSLMRAGIVFKNAHRNEQIAKLQVRTQKVRELLKAERAKHKRKK